MFSEEEIRDWELLPLNVRVLTSQQMGAWLYYRDKRRDKRVKSGLLDKVAHRLPNEFCKCCNQETCEGGMVGTIQECETIGMIKDVMGGVIEELKAEEVR